MKHLSFKLYISYIVVGVLGWSQAEIRRTVTENSVSVLIINAARISRDANSERKLLIEQSIRGPNAPQLSSLAGLRIGAKLQTVIKLFGKPQSQRVGEGQGSVYTYVRNGGLLAIRINEASLVTHISTNIMDIDIPSELHVGLLLEHFERVYGGRAVRTSESLSLGKRLVKYPYSNLALIVRNEGNVVESAMVFE